MFAYSMPRAPIPTGHVSLIQGSAQYKAPGSTKTINFHILVNQDLRDIFSFNPYPNPRIGFKKGNNEDVDQEYRT